jgi:phosphoribosylanthranilate isomerase
MSTAIKVCGLRDLQNIKDLAALKPDYMGFIFYEPSKRYFEAGSFGTLPSDLPESIKKVGVFVDSELSYIMAKVQLFGLRIVQLHGEESPAFCATIKAKGIEVWKAIGLSENVDLAFLNTYSGSIDAFLFDTKSPEKGGTGIQFNWDILKTYTLDIPFMLAGGISLENLDQAIAATTGLKLKGFDLNSKFEISPGFKNIAALKQAIKTIRK